MKKQIKIFTLMMALVLAMCGGITTQAAAKKDVTKEQKSSVNKFMKPYARFLAYSVADEDTNKKLKFDNVYKTNMVLYASKDWKNIEGKSIASVKKAYKAEVKKVFDKTAKFKLKVSNKQDYPSLFVNRKNKVKYKGGNWGMGMPYGKVGKVYQTGKNKYQVTYKIYIGVEGQKKSKNDYKGSYKINLKKSGKSYTITNIKYA